MKKVIFTPNAPQPIGPYSQAIAAGAFIFVSGQIAIDPKTGILIELNDIAVETKCVMENLKAIITASGCNLNQVVKCSIFLKDMSQFAEVNEVYGSYFTINPPARETVEVSNLPKGVNVEISAIVLQ